MCTGTHASIVTRQICILSGLHILRKINLPHFSIDFIDDQLGATLVSG